MSKMTGFVGDLVAQLRAGDTYGQLDRLSDEKLLGPFLISREQRQEMPVACDVDPATLERIRSYYQAAAASIEKATGAFTSTVVDLNHEGFGRVVILAGRLVVAAQVLRDAGRFGFASLEKLAARGESLVTAACKVIETYPEAARDDS